MSTKQLTATELAAAEMALAELGAEFDGLDAMMATASHDTGPMAELNAELSGTEFAMSDASFESLDIGQDPVVDEFFLNWIKNKVAKLIRKLVALVRRYADCAECVPKVTRAVALFKAKKYAAALKAAYDAYRCIQHCIRN
jgi:hypothetical protein